ncbi:hypothetical protein JCM8547_005837 [Rhodosporidiobolus lusitaniae]
MPTDAATVAAQQAQQAALLKMLQTLINQTLAPVVIATFISCALCGVVAAQVVTYYMRFPNDLWRYKFQVGFMAICAGVDTAITASWSYTWSVTYFTQPTMLALWPWQLTGPTGISVFTAQLFFAWRVWVVSDRKAYPLLGLLLLVIVGAVVCCFYMGVWGSQTKMLTEVGKISPVSFSWLGLELAADFAITAGLVWYILVKPRRDLPGPSHAESSPLMRIINYAFATNFFSAVVQLAVVVTIRFSMRDNNLWYCVPGFQESKVYIASVLAVLNARRQDSSPTSSPYPSSYGESRVKTLGTSNTRGRSCSGGGGGGSRAQSAGSIHVYMKSQGDALPTKADEVALEEVSPHSATFSSGY